MIEAEALSISPAQGEHMPVQTGVSITGSGKSAFYYVKTLSREDYLTDQENTVVCHFRTNKAVSETRIFAVNEYFTTRYLENTGNAADDDGKSVYLDNYTAERFDIIGFSKDPVACVAGIEVDFEFEMSALPADGKVKVSFGGVQLADESDPAFKYIGIENGYAVYEYTTGTSTDVTFNLVTADVDSELYVGLEAYHFVPNDESAARQWAEFTGRWSGSLTETAGDDVAYIFTIPADGYYDGMVVTVKLDGLQFASTPNSQWTNKGNGVYEYRPTAAGSVTMNLVSTEGGQKWDYVTISAPGFTELSDEIQQKNICKYI